MATKICQDILRYRKHYVEGSQAIILELHMLMCLFLLIQEQELLKGGLQLLANDNLINNGQEKAKVAT